MLIICAFALFAGDSTEGYMLKDENNTALKGLDVVSFFNGTPVKGSEDFQTEYAEVTWHFANQENLDAFLRSPSDYLPKYHGYCATALSNNRISLSSIEYWHVYDGGLYFFCRENLVQGFLEDPDGVSEKADENWQKMLDNVQ